MRLAATISLAFLFSFGLFGQRGSYVNPAPAPTAGYGGAVRTVSPFVPTLNGSVSFVSPLGTGRRVGTTGTSGVGSAYFGRGNRSTGGVYYYPLFVGGYGYPAYGYGGDGPVDGSQQQPAPNVTVIYPPSPAPVIISPYQGDNGQQPVRPHLYDMPETQPDDSSATPPEATHYLIAFKDHTIYSATNYWVDGDTLHYFTSGNTHNQVSLSLVDRALTARLNKESGNDMKLPPEQKQ